MTTESQFRPPADPEAAWRASLDEAAAPAPIEAIVAWNAAVLKYRNAREYAGGLAIATGEALDDAMRLSEQNLQILMALEAPTIGAVATKIRIAIFESLADDLPAGILIDLERISAAF